MVLFECDEGNDERDHREDAKQPILPPRLEKGFMGAIVHKGNDAHPQIPHATVHQPLYPEVGCRPGDIASQEQQAVKQRDLEIRTPGMSSSPGFRCASSRLLNCRQDNAARTPTACDFSPSPTRRNARASCEEPFSLRKVRFNQRR